MAKFKTKEEALKYIQSGKKIKMIQNLGGQFPAGSTHSCGSYGPNCYISGSNIYFMNSGGAAVNLLLSYFEGFAESKEDLEKEVLGLEAQVALTKDKIAYLEETKQTDFDNTEFKVWRTLKIINKKGVNDLDKAKAIATLINN